MPKLYVKGRFSILSIVMILLLVSAIYLRPFDRLIHRPEEKIAGKEFRNMPQSFEDSNLPHPIPPENKGRKQMSPPVDIVSIFLLIMLVLIVISTESVKRWRLTEQRAVQAESERAHAELSFLKAQINPHFLFNTLNNIYSLVVTNNENAADAVMKLSNIMRYVTDDVNELLGPLQGEIDCIDDYICLQKLRLGKNFNIQFSLKGNTAGKTIPPLTLMTFVENAFKHGVSTHEQTNIIIKIVAEDKYIHFFAQNTIFNKPRNMERNGIGIENTKKRLQALYPDKYFLNINENDKLYITELIIPT